MFCKRFFISAMATALAVFAGQFAAAQQFGGGNSSSGLFGSRSLGGGISGGGGSAFGGSGFGTPGNAVEQAQSGAGEVQGGERFTRDGRQAGAFVGADSADATDVFGGQMQGFQGSGLEQLLGAAAGRNFRNQGSTGGSSATPMRAALSLGFTPARPTATALTTQMSQRMSKLPNLNIDSPITIAMEGRTAILRGRVATAHDRTMVEQLALLEPGVSKVRNELQYPGQPAAAKTASPVVEEVDVGDIAPPTAPRIPLEESPSEEIPLPLPTERVGAPAPAAPTAPLFDD